MITQLDPPLPLETSKGSGMAHFVVDHGPETDLLWVVHGQGRGLLVGTKPGNPHVVQLVNGPAQAGIEAGGHGGGAGLSAAGRVAADGIRPDRLGLQLQP
jgi:hypothetical protein